MTLKTVLSQLVKESDLSGKEREIKLERGLVVAVRVDSIYTRLRLWRNSTRPSLAEWRAVQATWP